MKYTGSCHCGKIEFQVEVEIDKAMSCNCSICSKRGYLLVFIPEESFKLLKGKDNLIDYQFNKKVVHHYFCSTCGVACFGAGKGQDGKLTRAINIRCLDNFDFEKVPTFNYDGKSK